MGRFGALCIILSQVSLLLLLLLEAVRCEKCGPSSSSLAALDKIDCHPERGASESECLRRGCCWQNETSDQQAADHDKQPSCFFPANFNCYNIRLERGQDDQRNDDRHELDDGDDGDHDKHLESADWQPHGGSKGGHQQQADGTKRPVGFSWLLERRLDCPASGFHDDAKRLKLELNVYGRSVINIKISEPDRLRFEPKLPEISLPEPAEVEVAAPEKKEEEISDGIHNFGNQSSENELPLGNRLLFGNKDDELLSVELKDSGLLLVTHHKSGKILLESQLQKLIYGRRFIQFQSKLGSPLIYGLGQHMGDSLLKRRSKTYTMFNYGHPPQSDGRTAYSSYPFYINVNGASSDGTNGLATGALMLNSNAMDVVVRSQQNEASITWRLVGGVVNLFLFAGPQPHDVVGQYQSLVGKPALPPLWALGYHQSRLNYNQLLQIKQAWARARSAGIPVESVWTDVDQLLRSTSYSLGNQELAEMVEIWQQQFGMHYVTIVDPLISLLEDQSSYEALKLATSMDLFAYSPTNRLSGESSPAIVRGWCERSGLLDFTNREIVPYLVRILQEYRQRLSLDGVWLDMNEPEVFSNEDELCSHDEQLQYWPGERNLNHRTLCMAAQFEAGTHFDVHNLYAFYQSRAHFEALKALNSSRRPFVISRAQFVGQGRYGGSWLGDLSSTFEHLRWSLLGTIESSWFGQPLIGADICGFFGSATDELCARWFSLGAFYPLARNHNDGLSRDQDPGALNEDVQRSARVAMMKRYSLLPFLYSLFYRNHLVGEPVVSSMAFSFPESIKHMADIPQLDDQLVWGQSLVIAPVLEPNCEARSVLVAAGRWYDVSIGLPGTNLSEGPYDGLASNWPLPTGEGNSSRWAQRVENLRKPIDCSADGCLLRDLYTPLGSINLFLRGGAIIPTFRRVSHTSGLNSIWAEASFFLEVALDDSGSATGSLYYDSGESEARYNEASFWATSRRLTLTMLENGHKEALRFDGFVVYGVKLGQDDAAAAPKDRVYKNVRLAYSYDSERNILICVFKSLTSDQDEHLLLKRYENLVIRW